MGLRGVQCRSPSLTAGGRFQSHRYFEAEAPRVRAEMRIRPALARRAAAVVRRVRAELGGGEPVKVRRPPVCSGT
jgi:hypothetical protein